MTLWAGQFGTELTHDFHPDIPPSGLFWTAPTPAEAAVYDLDGVTASLTLRDLALLDFIPDGPGLGDSTHSATVSMSMQWSQSGAELTIVDPGNEFSGRYVECQATIEWSAAESGFTYVSAPASETITRFAQIGRERTGVFAQPPFSA